MSLLIFTLLTPILAASSKVTDCAAAVELIWQSIATTNSVATIQGQVLLELGAHREGYRWRLRMSIPVSSQKLWHFQVLKGFLNFIVVNIFNYCCFRKEVGVVRFQPARSKLSILNPSLVRVNILF